MTWVEALLLISGAGVVLGLKWRTTGGKALLAVGVVTITVLLACFGGELMSDLL